MPNKKLFVVMIAAASFVMMLLVMFGTRYEDYNTFHDPTGQYVLHVYTKRSWLHSSISFPGSSGDHPGFVVLKNVNGNTLGKAHLEMANLVDHPVWEKNRVSVRMVFEIEFENH